MLTMNYATPSFKSFTSLVQPVFMLRQVVARVSEADLRLKEASLAAEETNLASLAGRKREAEVRLSEARRESAQRSRAAEKLKLV